MPTSIVTQRKRSQPKRSQVFSEKKVPEDVDVVVIGSGIGGLIPANLLSRAGLKCLVLEQVALYKNPFILGRPTYVL